MAGLLQQIGSSAIRFSASRAWESQHNPRIYGALRKRRKCDVALFLIAGTCLIVAVFVLSAFLAENENVGQQSSEGGLYSSSRPPGPLDAEKLQTLRSFRSVHRDFYTEMTARNTTGLKRKRFHRILARPNLLRENDAVLMARSAFNPVEEVVFSRADLEQVVRRKLISRAEGKALIEKYSGSRTTQLPQAFRENRVIFFVTPTYRRLSQMVDLLRVKQMLQLAALVEDGVPYWIIIEDASSCSQRIRTMLLESGLPFAHVHLKNKHKFHRGVMQRNYALDIIDALDIDGVVYFGDDDNAYDTRLFTELASVKRMGIFGVAFSAKTEYERCFVNATTGAIQTVISLWEMRRVYAMDMGGFALSTSVFQRENPPRFDLNWPLGWLEPYFLNLVDDRGPTKQEPLAANCTRLLVYHVKTELGKIEKESNDPNNDLVSALI